MSQFDFPRLNFTGRSYIDPATANNGWFVPLVIFQPISIKAVCPPRVYVDAKFILNGKSLEDIEAILPPGAEIKEDFEGLYKGAKYVEILSIHTESVFKEWAGIPLGNYEADKAYWRLYQAVGPNAKGTQSLIGATPGYWNYYGTMQYRFLQADICSVAVNDNHSVTQIFTEDSENLPPEIGEMLGAKLDMFSKIGDYSTHEAVMVDLLPTMAMYSQIFCNRLNMLKGDKVLFSGSPKKGSLRLVNAFRVVNENMPQGASGTFFSAIPLEDLDDGLQSPVIQFLDQYRDKSRKLKGIFIQQVISEVEEVRSVNYKQNGKVSNAAFGKLCGTISPWYDEDMLNWPVARQLNGGIPFLKHSVPGYISPVAVMTPMLFQFQEARNMLVVDFLNNFPVINTSHFGDTPAEPSPKETNTYETYPLGTLDFVLQYESENSVENIPIGSITIDHKNWPREKYFKEGGIVEIPIPDHSNLSSEKLRNGNLLVFNKQISADAPLMIETPYVITSEQCGMYSEVDQDPAVGFRSNSHLREPFFIRIFKHGVPQKEKTRIYIIEIKISDGGAMKQERLYRIEDYCDMDRITFPNHEAANAIYLFSANAPQLPLTPQYPVQLLTTGFFVNLKVLPTHDYGRFLNPKHPEYRKVTFADLYDEIFKTYSMITPLMRFEKHRWDNEHMAKLLVEKTHPEFWADAGYMPISRDLSEDQLELIWQWASEFKKLEKPIPIRGLKKEMATILKTEHLDGIEFFNK
ncbi:MAG: hypothetical protein KG003_01165 [Bacteroidetes bacterium]|nr:hypothetical protein [Bacteroidota bacterium]